MAVEAAAPAAAAAAAAGDRRERSMAVGKVSDWVFIPTRVGSIHQAAAALNRSPLIGSFVSGLSRAPQTTGM